MIQRIQTMWLLLGMACGVLLYYFPFWQASQESSALGMDAIGAGTNFNLVFFPALIFITHSISIFTFKKRKRQLMWCNLSILLFTIFFIAAFVILQTENQVLQKFNPTEFKFGAVLPLIGIILNLMARRGIKRDEALIRSMDRLR